MERRCAVCGSLIELGNSLGFRIDSVPVCDSCRRVGGLEQIEKTESDLRAQLSEAQAEIERLKVQIPRTKAEIERQQRITKIVSEHLWFYKSRAAAWKRCAKRWHSGLQWLADCNGFFDENEFSIMKKNCEFVNIAKAPPDWRKKWIPTSPEDKSALDEKPDSSES